VTPDLSTYSAVVRLDVESRPESLTLVRSLLSAIGEALALDLEFMDDMRTAVSEACNNVVLHAYEQGSGPLTVSLIATARGVHVLVRDSGGGMRRVSPRPDRMGVGLAVIGALAERMEFRSNSDGGTDVRMWFSYPGVDSDEPLSVPDEWLAAPPSLAGDIVVSVEPVSLLAPVLARLTRAAAAQSRFTTDGIAEIAEVTDAVAAHAAELSPGDSVEFSLSTTTRRLELTAGPFGAVEVVADQQEPSEPSIAVNYDFGQPEFEPIGDRKLLRTVIVDERVSA
jgi:anti-sigma regulatory factor (Ser/Thr protein kinase)